MQSSPGLEIDRRAVSFHFLTFGLIVGTFMANVPYIQERQALDLTDIGHLILSINAGNVLGVYAARLRRLSARTSFLIMSVMVALGLSALGLGQGKAQLVAAGLVLGTGTGLLAVFANSSGALIESRYGVLVLPKMHADFSKGLLLGALGGLAAALAGLPYACGFLLLLGPVGLGARLALSAPSIFASRDEDGRAPGEAADRRGRRRVLVVLGTVAFISIIVEGAVLGWSGILMKDDLRVPADLLPLGVLAFTVCAFLARRHGDRLIAACGGKRRTLLLSLSVAACLSALLGFLSNAWLGLAAIAIIGTGMSLVIPIVFSLAGSLVAKQKGQLIGDISLIGYAASLLGPSLVAFLASRYGIKASLSSLAIGLIVGVLVVAAGRAVLAGEDAAQPPAGRA